MRQVLAVASLLLTSAAVAQPKYTVQVIGGLDPANTSGLVSMPLGINNNGRTVGYSATATSQSQIINWKGGTVYASPVLAGANRSFGSHVNILGRIAGAAYTVDANGATLQSRAVRWKGLIPADLGTLGGLNSAALGINDSDKIVGYSTLPGEAQVGAFLWANGSMSALPMPVGATQAYAYDISNSDHIAGVVAGPGPARPVVWRNGVVYPLPIPAWSRTGGASAVNDSGTAVGNYEINQFAGTSAAVAWYGGQRVELGNLGGSSDYAIASDVNNSGQIVGTSNSPNGYTGFLWSEGEMYDLRSLLLPGAPDMQITSARAINDRGQIAAAAMINGRTTAVLLTPVMDGTPAPASVSLLALAGVFVQRRRRR